jgi:hypothetical protein
VAIREVAMTDPPALEEVCRRSNDRRGGGMASVDGFGL